MYFQRKNIVFFDFSGFGEKPGGPGHEIEEGKPKKRGGNFDAVAKIFIPVPAEPRFCQKKDG